MGLLVTADRLAVPTLTAREEAPEVRGLDESLRFGRDDKSKCLSGVADPNDAAGEDGHACDGQEGEDAGGQESVGDGGGAMDAPRGPEIVGNNDERHCHVDRDGAGDPKLVGEGPTVDGGANHGHGAEDHQSFVRGRSASLDHAPGSEAGEESELLEVANQDEFAGNADGVAPNGVEDREHAEDDHERRQDDAKGPERDVPTNVAGGDQYVLEDEQKDPGDEECAMDVHQCVRQFGKDHAGEEIALCEADDNDCQNDEGGGWEEDVVGAQRSRSRSEGSGHMHQGKKMWARFMFGEKAGKVKILRYWP